MSEGPDDRSSPSHAAGEPLDEKGAVRRRKGWGTKLARVGLVMLAATLVVAVPFGHIIFFYPFIVAIAVGFIAIGLWINAAEAASGDGGGERR